MEFTEIINCLKDFEGKEEYENYINGLMNDDRVNAYLQTEAGKKMLQPQFDKYFNKGLETWKKNNLQGLIDSKIKELYPDQTPEQKRIAELEAKIAQSEANALKDRLITYATKIAITKNLPTDLIDYFIGTDEETTNENLEKLETVFNVALERAVTEKLGESHKPESADNSHTLTANELETMSINEINAYYNKQLSK